MSENITEDNTPPATEALEDDVSIAGRQLALGEAWASVFSNPDLPIDNNAEMVLRNPVAYLSDIDPAKLPEELQNRWHKLLGFCDGVAAVADTEIAKWAPDTRGLEKVQTLVYSGRINPDFRGSVADIMRVASKLFAESSRYLPGNTRYYQGNIEGADASFRKYRPEGK